MGLIKAALGSAGGALADTWKEMIYCESIPADVLVTKGKKRTSGRSSNTRGDANIITNGSIIVVNSGQAMAIVEQGKVIEFSAEPGEYTYDNELAPTIFAGTLGEGIAKTFENIGKRFSFGGDTGVDQRVYYFNMKEIIGNKYGTASPVPFRVVDENIGLDIDISVRCNGEYSYRICNPILFYTNVCGNVADVYTRGQIDSQLKSELLTALQPAFAKISAMGIRYSAVPAHTVELADALNEALSSKWRDTRGIEVASFGVNAISASEEDEKIIKDLQRAATMRDPRMAAANLTAAQGDAMRAAAANEGGMGAMGGFIGMNMAANAGGMNAQQMYGMSSQPQQSAYTTAPGGGYVPQAPAAAPAPEQPAADTWTCSTCGTVNTGKFCMECGAPKPAGAPRYRCSNCGWVPADQTKPPKFCPNCGDPFNEGDIEQ